MKYGSMTEHKAKSASQKRYTHKKISNTVKMLLVDRSWLEIKLEVS